jgi:hypothetical protein
LDHEFALLDCGWRDNTAVASGASLRFAPMTMIPRPQLLLRADEVIQ